MMRYWTLLLPAILIMHGGCGSSETSDHPPEKRLVSKDSVARNDSVERVEVPALRSLLDSHNVAGSVIVYDAGANRFLGTDFEWADKGFLPASTFKIVNSIIGFETGVIESREMMFKWDGTPRRLPQWEQDMTLQEAFHRSCVPCYQEIARKIGVARMKEYLDKFKYGHMVVVDTTIDRFWLEGDSKITQNEQIEFLRKLYFNKLPISARTSVEIKKVMLIETTADHTLSGKTGWAIRNGNNIGWFVGWLETAGNVYFIATNIRPRERFDMDRFPIVRTLISMEAFRRLNIMK